MDKIARNSDKGKEKITSPTKKTDFTKIAAQEKLTLDPRHEYLKGGMDKGESSKKQTTDQQSTRQQTDQERNRQPPTKAEVDAFSAWAKTWREVQQSDPNVKKIHDQYKDHRPG